MKRLFTLLLLAISTTSMAQICYKDNDGDGYGNPDEFVAEGVFGCPLTGNWVKNNLDCNDGAAAINPFTVWYKDLDNDRYSDGIIKQQCTQPAGYIRFPLNGVDCDDNDRFAHPRSAWVADPDNDFYVDGIGVTILQCNRPSGYIETFEILGVDCNQNDPLEHEDQRWYKDADGDKYPADLTVVVQCSRPIGYSAEIELIALTLDCADDDASLTPATVWYKDFDNDGYTDGTTKQQCTQPENYKRNVLNGIDCNDNDAIQHPNQSWYRDDDGDRHGKGLFVGGQLIISCSRPTAHFAQEELLSLDDCNDANAVINPQTAWYLDADNDNYYAASGILNPTLIQPVIGCASPGAGWKHTGLIGGGDCNDANAAINPQTTWYLDADNDNYYVVFNVLNPTLIQPITGCTSPGPGWKHTGLLGGGDCNDANAAIHPQTAWYLDADNDNYYVAFNILNPTTLLQPIIGCTSPGIGWKHSGLLGGSDCNDADFAVNPATVWYLDADNDNYYTGNSVTQCSSPGPGYKRTGLAGGGDCNDAVLAINPATVWYLDADNDNYYTGNPVTQCASPGAGYKRTGIVGGSDCNDADAAINPATVWYLDADNDNYYAGNPVTQCATPGAGYRGTGLIAGGDCNDAISSINPATMWFKDADNDGYSNGLTQIQCSRPANYKLATELTAISGDCHDIDPTINPAAVEVCNNSKDDNCNGVQNGQGCYTCTNATSFSTTNITSNSATLNWVSIPHPDHWKVQFKTTAPGSKWVDVAPDPGGNKRSVTITGLVSNQNYIWHIKAKCGNSWTSYSVSMSFITGGNVTTANKTSNAEKETTGVSEGLQIKAMPNPTKNYFIIVVNSTRQQDPMKIVVTDMLGRVIETRTTEAGQIIRIGENYRSGVYLVTVIHGSETRQVKLVKTPG